MFILFIIWLVGAVLAYGMSFAAFQKEYPKSSKADYWKDLTISIFTGLLSWIIVIFLILDGTFAKYGIKFK